MQSIYMFYVCRFHSFGICLGGWETSMILVNCWSSREVTNFLIDLCIKVAFGTFKWLETFTCFQVKFKSVIWALAGDSFRLAAGIACLIGICIFWMLAVIGHVFLNFKFLMGLGIGYIYPVLRQLFRTDWFSFLLNFFFLSELFDMLIQLKNWLE